ncbi:hypothetical protein GGI04_001619 [Coemansia thaxteri]|uniref:Uncharacterized protein n=1 Tax=Coemansia thaxteri TaxID=2663907 RepID=A0A9W8EIN3_9FUNG|nr:hypothetical protein H4R26_003959 [Coemansia thaxteri]KAJ2007147.1 hypothetical protein GGI04_001619 [Coemansia thaxteri]KAJ2335890.1 hypothetical protein GGH92_007902 [Coemansia sp. RSA 2673]KAJ2472325.1 hypothetical protein GGI02_001655 [Coemansia sp. RSA 2322]
MYDPLTIALYQNYREHACVARFGCQPSLTPQLVMYIIAGNCAVCFSSFATGIVCAVIIRTMYYDKAGAPTPDEEVLKALAAAEEEKARNEQHLQDNPLD